MRPGSLIGQVPSFRSYPPIADDHCLPSAGTCAAQPHAFSDAESVVTMLRGSAGLHAFQGGMGAKPPQGVLSYFELPNSDNSISCSSDQENSKSKSDQALSLLVFL